MKISVITVTKNNKAGLSRAIECVRNQTYPNIEHIIVDGGSTDGSAELLRGIQNSGNQKLVNSKEANKSILPTTDYSLLTTNYSLLVISEADSGIYDAINKGIKLATGDVIGLLHSDDLYADENVLSSYAEKFRKPFVSVYPEQSRRTQGDREKKLDSGSESGMTGHVDAIYSDLVYVRKKGEVSRQRRASIKAGSEKLEAGGTKTPHSLLTTNYSLLTTGYSVIRYWKTQKEEFTTETQRHRALQNGWMPPHPTLFLRREIFEKYGLYNTDLRIASDYEMILRLLFKHKITSCYFPLTTYLMSIGGASNKSIGNIIQKSKEDFRAMKINSIKFPVLSLISKNLRKLPQFLARSL